MGDKSQIEWTDATWNPVTGCTKVSQGCKHCYAERLWPKVEAAERMRLHFEWRTVPARPFTEVRCHPERLDQPLRWAKPRRIFVNSMSDLFHEAVPFEFIAAVFAVMSVTTRHTYQILTKRPQRMLDFFQWERTRKDSDGEVYELKPDDFACGDRISEHWPESIPWNAQHNDKRGGYDNCGPGWPYENVWLGVSVEDQATADERIPLLLRTPAAVRFLSCEPLLGPLDLSGWLSANALHEIDGGPRIDWVIAGGESGPKARPSHPDWVRGLRDQCAAAKAPFFFKQWGEWYGAQTLAEVTIGALSRPPGTKDEHWWPDHQVSFRLGKKAAGRTLDGRTHDEFPATP